MLRKLFDLLNYKKDYIEFCAVIANSINITNLYGIARSCIAFSLILTLSFNSMDVLFPSYVFESNDYLFWNFFYLLQEKLLFAKIISIVILVSVISGYYPRFTGILHWYIAFSFVNISPLIEGGDQIGSIITLFLIPITLLDSRKNHWSLISKNYQKNPYKNIVSYFVFVIIKIQVSIIYFHAAVGKFNVDEWVNGTALYYWFLNPIHGAPSYLRGLIEFMFNSEVLLTLLTWSILLFEIILSMAIFVPSNKIKYRLRLLFFALVFHFGIILVHGLVSFYFSMMGALILYLIPSNFELEKSNIGFKLKDTSNK